MKILFPITTLLFYSSCISFDRVSRKVRNETRLLNRYEKFAAIQVDTVQRIFRFYRNGRFDLIKGPSQTPNRKQGYYTGVYNENSDTVFLDYYKHQKLQEMKDSF